MDAKWAPPEGRRPRASSASFCPLFGASLKPAGPAQERTSVGARDDAFRFASFCPVNAKQSGHQRRARQRQTEANSARPHMTNLGARGPLAGHYLSSGATCLPARRSSSPSWPHWAPARAIGAQKSSRRPSRGASAAAPKLALARPPARGASSSLAMKEARPQTAPSGAISEQPGSREQTVRRGRNVTDCTGAWELLAHTRCLAPESLWRAVHCAQAPCVCVSRGWRATFVRASACRGLELCTTQSVLQFVYHRLCRLQAESCNQNTDSL